MGITSRPKPKLSPSRSIRVVVNGYVEVESLSKSLTKRFVSPVDVGRVVHRRLSGIDESRRGNTGGDDLLAVTQLLDHANHEVGDGSGVTRRGGLTKLRDDFSLIADERASDLRSADVYSDGVHERRV